VKLCFELSFFAGCKSVFSSIEPTVKDSFEFFLLSITEGKTSCSLSSLICKSFVVGNYF
jgi:hypothetical protein